jgi:hypothetical protein
VQWTDRVETIGVDEYVEIPERKTYDDNEKLFTQNGFDREKFEKVFPIIEQQIWSAFALFCCARSVPAWGTIVEIGSGRGGSLATMMLANPVANFINIDRFQQYEEETHGGIGKNRFKFTEFVDNITPFGGKLRTILKWSDEAVDEIEDKSVHMVFVDGNHGDAFVRRDIYNYSQKLVPGGILCGHDYHPRFPGVINAVKETVVDFFVAKYSSVWIKKEGWME